VIGGGIAYEMWMARSACTGAVAGGAATLGVVRVANTTTGVAVGAFFVTGGIVGTAIVLSGGAGGVARAAAPQVRQMVVVAANVAANVAIKSEEGGGGV
jgi:hypothetical protein